jgi:CheY-like chemotaxis protein
LLAGRKLLLADDSITIQKVVDLTFADEGVNVVCVSNGRDAIERLDEFEPDIVIADVLMPQINGYEVCEYIKQNDKLKHIPVMLLVGSFEPFDEAEARRVGADDTLTKPFQSIRSLIDKVGHLVGRRPAEGEAPTAELPKPDVTPEPEKLSEQEIEFTTADTQQLPSELAHLAQEWAPHVKEEGVPPTSETKVDDQTMESNFTETSHRVYEENAGEADVLLDLGDFEPGRSASGDDFLLELDLDEVPEPMESALPAAAFASTSGYEAPAGDWSDSSLVRVDDEIPTPTVSQSAITEEFHRPGIEVAQESGVEPPLRDGPIAEEQAQPGGTGAYELSLERLSPEVIDAIARRAVELLSEKVVREIAWEVVPQLAELLIKRQLEEKNS